MTTRSADGWPALFAAAFRQSTNAMALVDERRCHVDVKGAYLKLVGYQRAKLLGQPIYELVAGGPLASPEQWAAQLSGGDFTGATDLVCADGPVASPSRRQGAGRRLARAVNA